MHVAFKERYLLLLLQVHGQLNNYQACPRCQFVPLVLSALWHNMPQLASCKVKHQQLLWSSQLLTVLGSQQLVNLMQFNWSAPNAVYLSDSLLKEPRLLLLFMKASLQLLKVWAVSGHKCCSAAHADSETILHVVSGAFMSLPFASST